MLKDDIQKDYEKLLKEKSKEDNMSDNMNMSFKGELEIWATKNGKIIHHDKDHNIVTNWAKHATMHMMTSEAYSTHGNRVLTTGVTAYTKREESGHILSSANPDGTMISNEQYLGDNTNYYNGGSYKYQTIPNPNVSPDTSPIIGDSNDGFVYPFFPTKMLFGTGVEYRSWQAVADDGRDGSGLDGYGNPSNGSWTQQSFEDFLIDGNQPIYSNYYSALWDGTNYELIRTRTLNDVYSGALTDEINPITENSFAVKGAIKDATFDGSNALTVLTLNDGKYFAAGSYRGIGQPVFIYATRGPRFMQDGDVLLDIGEVSGTEHLESKITFTIIMPEQPNGEFYPYNGYTLKVAGLFADTAMLLKNTVPTQDNTNNDDVTNLEYSSYAKMPSGLMWATRNISPIYKSHDTQIIAQWTIYL